ncbi:MAG: ABC transporter permease subunit [Armatimonadetes bacterium]|nr:ABC transporter permease subunit [Armatimonadota bacterium]MDE2206748.1 ABC transporter permease subunit [Armatimonadota bacterium]
MMRLALRVGVVFALATLTVVGNAQSVIVGSKRFTESYVLGDIAQMQLRRAGIAAQHKQGMGGTIILWRALTSNAISLYPEYTGTISEEILKHPSAMTDDALRAALKPMGIGMTPGLGFNDTYALVMLASRARALGISRISDLRNHPNLVCAPTPEFLGRKDGWKPMCARYGLHMTNVRGVDHALGYEALKKGEIDLKDAYSTDAQIADDHLTVLTDDLNFFPGYRAVYLYRLSLPQTAVSALDRLSGTIDDAKMQQLNALAEHQKDYRAAARAYFGESPHAGGGRLRLARDIVGYTLVHLKLTGLSLLLAVVVGIPLGIVAATPGARASVILGAVGTIQTIPSLALLALLVAVPMLGISARTAIVALFLYSLLPIVQNTATGLRDIPAPTRESAEALGLPSTARLRSIYLPMASRSILAGIRTSAVINVGTATLAALIGAGGLGEPIISGLNLNDTGLILEGAIPAAVLALLLQWGFELLDRVVIPRGLRLQNVKD